MTSRSACVPHPSTHEQAVHTFTASLSSQLKGADQATEVPRPIQTDGEGRRVPAGLGLEMGVQAVGEREGARARAGRSPKEKTNEDQPKLGPGREQLSRGQ